MKIPRQPEINIGMVGHVDHGKTTLTKAFSGVWTDTHSEEIKRGISIRLGYADAAFYRCPSCEPPECFTTKQKCPHCGEKAKLLRTVSFVDAPGHETLMATMISGASLMDGAILLIAANETCPQPQTKEHLRGLEISGVRNIVIVQNKIDLVSEEKSIEHYRQIKEFIKGTIAEDAPIIPVSAHHDVNLDVLIGAVEDIIKTPKRDSSLPSRMYIARSFDVNKPGTSPEELEGGVIGGSLSQGILRLGDEMEIRPGIKVEERGKSHWEPLFVKIHSLVTGGREYKQITPGGLSAIGTLSGPLLMKSDALSGKLLGKVDTLPPVWERLTLEVSLMERLVGTLKDMDIEKIRSNQPLMMSTGTATTVGVVTSAREGLIDAALKLPICADPGQRVALSRNIAGRWHLIGYGIIQG